MLELADQAVSKALKGGAEKAEVFIMKESSSSISIEKNAINFASSAESFGIGIRVIRNKRLGFAYCTEPAKIGNAIRDAVSVSRLGKKECFSFPAPGKTKKIKRIYDKKVVELGPTELLEIAECIIQSGTAVKKGLVISSGGVGIGASQEALANSEGVRAENIGSYVYAGANALLKTETSAYSRCGGKCRSTFLATYGIAKQFRSAKRVSIRGVARGDSEVSTGFELAASRMLDVDFSDIGRNAAELAVKSVNPKKTDSGEKSVLFTPYAFSALAEFALVPAFYGDIAHRGESVYSNKVGEIIAAEGLSVFEDSTLENGLNSAETDDEGIPSKKTALIERGVLKNYLYDTASAVEFGKQSTSSGVRAERFSAARTFKALPSVKARNIIFECRKKYSIENMLSDIRSGVIVYDVMGAHTANPASGDFSVNSSILFEIKNGEIKSACKPAMLSGNFPECLRNISQIGNDYRKIPGSLSTVSVVAPTVRVENIRITS